jgi:hypothetical protein
MGKVELHRESIRVSELDVVEKIDRGQDGDESIGRLKTKFENSCMCGKKPNCSDTMCGSI